VLPAHLWPHKALGTVNAPDRSSDNRSLAWVGLPKRADAIDVDRIVAGKAQVMNKKLYGKPLDRDAARAEQHHQRALRAFAKDA